MQERKTLKMNFEVNLEQYAKYVSWVKEQNKKAVEIQKEKYANDPSVSELHYEVCWNMGLPYCGAIGGEISWTFTPTGLGEIITVKHSITGDKLNLTDYASW